MATTTPVVAGEAEHCHHCQATTTTALLPLASGHIGRVCAVCRTCRLGRPYVSKQAYSKALDGAKGLTRHDYQIYR